MERKTRNNLVVAVLLILSAGAVLFACIPMIRLAVDAVTALLRSWGVLPGIGPVFYNTLKVLVLVLAVTLPLSLLITLWMYESVKGAVLKSMQRFLHGFTRVPAVLLGLIGYLAIEHSLSLHESVYTLSALLILMSLPFMITRMDTALRAVPEHFMMSGLALGGGHREVLRKIVLPQAMPGIMRGVLELVERILSETTALLVMMGAVMPNQVLATELFRLEWLGRKDAAVLAFLLMAMTIVIRFLTSRRWRTEGGENTCRFNWW